MSEERIQKILASAGLASRRKAEELILAGRISVNGEVVTTLGSKADIKSDEIRIDGQLVGSPERHVYFMLYKPKGVMTTVSDPEGRQTVMDLMHGVKERIFPVGRLDYLSEGLLLMTNDGELMAKLTQSSQHVSKTYMVKIAGHPSDEDIEKLRCGITLPPEPSLTGAHEDDPGQKRRSFSVHTQPARIQLARDQENPWYEVTLTEGRNRQIRRMFKEIGHHVEKIKRIRYATLELNVEPAEWRPLSVKEVNELKRSMEEKGLPIAHPDAEKQSGEERVERRPSADYRPSKGDKVEARYSRPGSAVRRTDKFIGKRRDDGNVKGHPYTRTARYSSEGKREVEEERPERPAYRPRTEGGSDRPRRSFAPRTGGDRPYKPRFEADGDRPRRSFAPRGDGDRPSRPPYKPRFDSAAGGDRPRPPYKPRFEADGDRPRRPFTPRGDSDRPSRPPYKPRFDSAAGGDRPRPPYKPRFEADGDRPRRPFTPRTDGDRPSRPPYKPRFDSAAGGDRPRPPYKPRFEADGDRPRRPFTPRTDGDRPSRPSFKPRFDSAAGGDRPRPPYKPRFEADGDRPRRPFTPRADGDRPSRPSFKPRFDSAAGGDRPRPAYKPRVESIDDDRPKRTGFKPRFEEGVAPRPHSSYDDRPSGGFGKKPSFGGKPSFGKKPAFGKKPGGFGGKKSFGSGSKKSFGGPSRSAGPRPPRKRD